MLHVFRRKAYYPFLEGGQVDLNFYPGGMIAKAGPTLPPQECKSFEGDVFIASGDKAEAIVSALVECTALRAAKLQEVEREMAQVLRNKLPPYVWWYLKGTYVQSSDDLSAAASNAVSQGPTPAAE